MLLLGGAGGIGKSRLAAALADERRRAGWTVASGRAYAVEAGVPFALFSDAFMPLLSGLKEGALATLARGTEADLARLFPGLARVAADRGVAGANTSTASAAIDSASRTELFWSFARILKGMAAKTPMLVVLEDLHWSDPSSLELLHFLARQLASDPVVFVGTLNDDERARHPTLREVERSLGSLGLAVTQHLEPLSRAATEELVREAFGVGAAVASGFARLLHERTGGNLLLIEATLAALVDAGTLHRESGTWLGWEVSSLATPQSVRDAVLLRVQGMSDSARAVAEAAAVIGSRARLDTLRDVSGLGDAELVAALEELRERRILEESAGERLPIYDFANPLARDVLTEAIGLARRALMHARAAESLETAYGRSSLAHADELAFHFARAGTTAAASRALPYLAAAGRSALRRFADREAASYLRLALDTTGSAGGESTSREDRRQRLALVEDLGRALRRLGDLAGAIGLWSEGAQEARERGEPAAVAALLRRVGLARFFAGSPKEALAAYDDAATSARDAGDALLLCRILVARAVCLQSVGRVGDASADLVEALALAQTTKDDGVLARTHRTLLLFHTWSGPLHVAREHGRAALSLAERAGDVALACSCHWALSVLEGLGGQAEECAKHLESAERLNEEVGSPILGLAIAEVRVEYAFGTGVWDTALAVGERALALGRSLGQRGSLPRLLVWTGLVYLGRDAIDRARACFEEAWRVSGAGSDEPRDVHAVVPAHIGVASQHIAMGELDEAVRVAEAALALVDRTGYRIWAGHRLLPVLAEAHLIRRDLAGAREVGARLRSEAEALDDPLALAWADASDAVALWLGGSGEEAAAGLARAAERLEAIPYIPDALRLRRRLAACLADNGDRDAAVSELRRVHDGFARLRAERELEKTRRALHELGARPPTRTVGAGAAGLTARELQIAGLAAANKSSKAIAKELGISARTVDTHLTSVFKKLGVASRVELTEVVRTLPTGE